MDFTAYRKGATVLHPYTPYRRIVMTAATRPPFSPPLAAPARWTLDSSASRVDFSVRQFWGMSTVDGRFARFDGELRLDSDGTGDAELRIEAASVKTGNSRRDRHLRAAGFFDCDRHPLVRFVAGVAPGEGGSLKLRGELGAAGRAIALELVATGEGGDDRLELTASAKLDARELGMTWSPVGNLRTPVAIAVRASLQRAA
jgi:polyisoprenoid-binding protein YceI